MELEFDVHVDANALYDYMLRHTFTKAAGISGKYSRRARCSGQCSGIRFM